MAWPFSKKKQHVEESKNLEDVHLDETQEADAAAESAAEGVEQHEEELAFEDQPDPIHDAKTGTVGPFDADTVNIEEFDFSDFTDHILNLGSIKVPMPRPSEVQVEMGPQGPKMLHILTEYGRITPVAFAAPTTPGQWRESTKHVAKEMREQGLQVHVEQGPWGRELVGQSPDGNGIIRIIGVDGPRWMLRLTLAAPKDKAEAMAALGRDVAARTFVVRGDQPILAGNSLPVALPDALAQQLQQQIQERAAQKQAQQGSAADKSGAADKGGAAEKDDSATQ